MSSSKIIQRNKIGVAQVSTSDNSIARLLGYRGQVGAQGDKGTSGWRGEYDENASYTQYDIVRYFGTVYILLSESASGILPTDTDNWEIFVEKGLNGVSGTSSSSNNGFINITDSSIDIDLVNKTVSIIPTNTLYTYNINGVEVTKDTIDSIQIPASSNHYYVYFNNLNTLVISSTERPSFTENTLICSFYYNNTQDKIVFFNDLRHSNKISDYSKQLFYIKDGQFFLKGFSLTNNSNADGVNDSDLSVSVSEGETLNLDLKYNIQGRDSFNILYIQSGELYSTPVQNYIVKLNSTIEYNINLNNLENVTSEKPYTISWIVAIGDDIFIVLGGDVYISLEDAKEAQFVNFDNFNFKKDTVVLHKLIIKYDQDYQNSIKASILYVDDIRVINNSINNSLSGDKNYTFTQSFASNIWIVDHDLNKIPAVTVIDSGGNEVVGDINFINNNKLIITFTAQFTGSVYLN